MNPEKRQAIIAALLKKDMDSIREQKGEIVIIHNYFEHLKFTNTIGRQPQDFDKIVFAPGEYRDALMKLNTDNEGELTGMPFWMVPAEGLTDAEIEKFKDGNDNL